MKSTATRLHKTDGATIMEYALVLIVIGLTVLFIANRFGVTLKARYRASKATVDMTKVDPNSHVEVDDQGLTGTAQSVPNP
jgi:hypothetical protein